MGGDDRYPTQILRDQMTKLYDNSGICIQILSILTGVSENKETNNLQIIDPELEIAAHIQYTFLPYHNFILTLNIVT